MSKPQANADAYATQPGHAITRTAANGLLANDTDPAGLAVAIDNSTAAADGSFTVNPDGGFTYTPNAGFTGLDTATYQISDGSGVSTASVTFYVLNPGPAATADTYTLRAGKAFVRTAAQGVLANDTDAGGAALTVTGNTKPAHGTLDIAADGSFSYSPNPGYVGADAFSYTVSDGGSTASGSVSLNVVDTAPVAGSASYITSPGTSVIASASNGLLANASDAEGDALSVNGSTQPQHGSVVVAANGGFTYTPAAGYFGPDSFTYTVTDGALSSLGTADILVQDAGPIVVPHNFTALQGTALVVSGAEGILANDIDPDGYPLTYTLWSTTSLGTLKLQPDGGFTYTTASTAFGTDHFSYYVSDGTQQVFSQATIYVNEPGIDGGYGSEAVASPDAYITRPGVPITRGAADGVLANDAQAEGKPFQLYSSQYTGPNTFDLQTDGSFVFTPAPGFVGTDSATYTDFAGGGYFSTTVTFYVVNTPPTAINESFSLHAGAPFSRTADQGLLANDIDVNGDKITIASFTQPGHGSVTVNPDGSFTYTPANGFTGTDSFTYTDTDGYTPAASLPTATVTLKVVDGGPSADNDSFTTQPGQVLTRGAATGLLANDSDPDAATITATAKTAPAHGAATVNADGSFTYTPKAGFVGSDSFTYTVSDGVVSSTGTATIAVTSTAPIATPDAYAVLSGGTLSETATGGVLANDLDASPLTATVSTAPAHGALHLKSDGSFSYVPNAGFTGADSFSYTATAGALGSSANVTVQVVACFAAGTRIATPTGLVAVEHLRAGDLVQARFAGAVPVKWIGHRHLDCRHHKRPRDAWPVRISSDAFGAGMPRHILFLSPDHAVFIDGALIPVRYLINGGTVRQVRCDAITYFHVELDTHDVLSAEGLPCESFLDTGNKSDFEISRRSRAPASSPTANAAPYRPHRNSHHPARP